MLDTHVSTQTSALSLLESPSWSFRSPTPSRYCTSSAPARLACVGLGALAVSAAPTATTIARRAAFGMAAPAADEYARCSSRVLSRLYGYPSDEDPSSFGMRANIQSCRAAVQAITAARRAGHPIAVEKVAEAVHDGWALAARTVWDATKYGSALTSTSDCKTAPSTQPGPSRPGAKTVNPHPNSSSGPKSGKNQPALFQRGCFASQSAYDKYKSRVALGATPYTELSDDEKAKDRAIVETILQLLQREGQLHDRDIIREDVNIARRVHDLNSVVFL